jgi:ABC-type multidrug transport system fused ATPase/permease subunit
MRLIDTATWKRAIELLDQRERRHALYTLGVVVAAAFSSAFMVSSILPFLAVLADPKRIQQTPALAWIYHEAGFTSDYDFLVALGLGSFLVILVASLIQVVKSYVVSRFTMMRIHSISMRLMSSYLRQPYAYFLDKHSGEMSNRVLLEAQQVVQSFFKPALDLVASMLSILAVVALLLWINPPVAAVVLSVFVFLYGLVVFITRRRLEDLGRQRLGAGELRSRIVSETFGGIKDIKLLGRERSSLDRYARPSIEVARAMTGTQVVYACPQYLLHVVAFGGMILLCLALIDPHSLASGAGIGTVLPMLGVFAFAGQRLMPELSNFYQAYAQLKANADAVNVIHADMSGLSGGSELPVQPPPRMPFRRAFCLEDISFRYPGSTREAISRLSLDIRAGERIGIVGGSGAGKTTIVDIIMGLLVPDAGRVTVDGVVVDGSNVRSWQQNVGYVQQDIFLVDAGIAQNIALGVPDHEIDHEKVRSAARLAQIDDFIETELPQGYATTVGERGVRLSGGQRQRIGIARALYRDSELLVFDEATSALDNRTEADVLAAIAALPGDKTIITIAHRLSTVRNCDRILVLDDGRLAAAGTWDELTNSSTAFRRLVGETFLSGNHVGS